MFRLPWIKWGIVLGFALGGFFDGILLHQILQWHHLLSLIPAADDLRVQVLWDGYFHALMYVFAVVGIIGILRSHASVGCSTRHLGGALLVGFGVWHIVDGLLSHWLLGIHRIKVDSQAPLMWDLIWLVAFGLVPFGIGLILLRSQTGSSLRHAPTTLIFLGALTGFFGIWSLHAPSDQPFTTIVFRPDYGVDRVFSAIAAADARLVWSDSAMGVVIVSVDPGRKWEFYGHGALLISGVGVLAGCLNWTKV